MNLEQKGEIVPGYRGHLVGGVVAYGLLMGILYMMRPSCITMIGWCIATCAGALFPDVDTKSRGQRYFYTVVVFFLLMSLWRAMQVPHEVRLDIILGIVIIALLPLLSRHRGFTHNPKFIVGMVFALWIILPSLFPTHASMLSLYVLFFGAGALSHILLDRGLFKKRIRVQNK